MTSASASSSSGRKPLTGTLIGRVVSAKRDKTRTVEVSFSQRHAKYGKYLARSTKYHVHDPDNVSGLNDRVEIANCRPISKTKSWRLVKVVEKAPAPIEHVSAEEAAQA